MNATEKLVELYYRQKGCLTVTDVKVIKGNNRQFDILAIERANNKDRCYHIEVQVTHGLKWSANDIDGVKERIEKKFFGLPSKNAKRKTSYIKEIKETYEKYGFEYDSVIRVWCPWKFQNTESKINQVLSQLAKKYNIKSDLMRTLSFRDEVLKYLMDNVKTANYDDEIFRSLSLIKQMYRQSEK